MEKHILKKLLSHHKLAQERTILANERNTLAYLRTGFAAFVLGIAMIKLFGESAKSIYAGFGAIILSFVLVAVGLIYHSTRKKKILKY
ncbi:MAG: DUF202 domain-containing protein [Candidatus Pacearchaeota archaeon]|jgi:uncharacterized membrane protein YidH (DUF202 family)